MCQGFNEDPFAPHNFLSEGNDGATPTNSTRGKQEAQQRKVFEEPEPTA
jgi:hypothetical protein